MKIDNQTILCLVIIIITGVFLLKDCSNNNTDNKHNDNKHNDNKHNDNKHTENFTNNNSYTKFEETRLGNNKNNKNNKVWNNVSLAQCQFKCNENKECVGFVRPRSSNNKRTSCYVKTDKTIGDCHSLRKGDPDQRRKASNYNTFIKTSYLEKNKNLLTKCIGDNTLTLNQFIYIQSILKPNHFISVIDNEIKMGKFIVKGIDFNNKATFKIIKGLEGSGTISFILKDNNNENYYLYANQESNQIELVAIHLDKSTQKERTYASFELYDGLSDKKYISLKAFTTSDENKFLVLDGYGEKKTPQLILKEHDELKNQIQLESATFKIANNVTNNLITKQPFQNTSSNENTFLNTLKTHNNQNLVKKEKFNSITSKLILLDKDNNKLMIPLNNNLTKISKDKLNNFITKLNSYYKNSPNKNLGKERAFNKNNIVKIIISNPESFSIRIYDYDFMNNNENGTYKNIFEKENLINDDFTINSIQVFTKNPKTEFKNKIESNTDNNYDIIQNDFITSKLNHLEKSTPDKSLSYSFNKYKNNKKIELDDYKDMIIKTELYLSKEQEKLKQNLIKLTNEAQNYKLKKYAKDYFMKKNI